MARNELADVVNIDGENITARAEGEHPVRSVEDVFRQNIHAANRLAKRLLVKEVKNKLRTGVKGEGYTKQYAKEKRNDPRSQHGIYGTSGPVDFRYSGRLWNELVGRGRAKSSVPTLTFWIKLKHPNRTRPRDAPGSQITYRRLVEILRKEKPGDDGDPFGPGEEERENIAQAVAERLMAVAS